LGRLINYFVIHFNLKDSLKTMPGSIKLIQMSKPVPDRLAPGRPRSSGIQFQSFI
jgi:hypothetical protein